MRRLLIIVMCGFLVIVFLYVWRFVDEYYYQANWPDSGREHILQIAGRGPDKIECYYSTWMRNSNFSSQFRIGEFENNLSCQITPSEILWREYPNVINGTFRCEKGGFIGEYTLSAIKPLDTNYYGRVFCDSAHFPSTEKHNLGSVTDPMENPY